jgi:hypothetical protein
VVSCAGCTAGWCRRGRDLGAVGGFRRCWRRGGVQTRPLVMVRLAVAASRLAAAARSGHVPCLPPGRSRGVVPDGSTEVSTSRPLDLLTSYIIRHMLLTCFTLPSGEGTQHSVGARFRGRGENLSLTNLIAVVVAPAAAGRAGRINDKSRDVALSHPWAEMRLSDMIQSRGENMSGRLRLPCAPSQM